MATKKKLLVIGVDQAIPYLLNKYIDQDLLPNIKLLKERGIYGEAFSCPPCDTPTNWTTLATGATTAIHGATSFYLHNPGELFELSLKHRSRTQLSRFCKAQYFWDKAEEFNYIPYVINYPSGWPGNLKRGEMTAFHWPLPETLPKIIVKGFVHEYIISHNRNKTKSKKKGKNLNSKNLEVNREIKIKLESDYLSEDSYLEIKLHFNEEKEKFTLQVFLNSESYEINESTDSGWLPINLETIYGKLTCIFKVYFSIKQTEKESILKLQQLGMYNTKGWSYPGSFEKELVKNNVFDHLEEKREGVEYLIEGNIAPYLKTAQNKANSLEKAIILSKQKLNWDICFFHIHHLDSVNHRSLAPLYPKYPKYDAEKAIEIESNVKVGYKILDNLVGNIIEKCVDENTIVLFVSDHGAIPTWKIVDITSALQQAGLIKYKWKQLEKHFVVDWNETYAFPYSEPPYVWINKKNRDPHGIVKVSEVESIKEQIIDALINFRDPSTNQNIVKMACRKEDAAHLGQDGEVVGDIVYFLNPPYQLFGGIVDHIDASKKSKKSMKKPVVQETKMWFGAHAYYLPDERLGDFSISVPWILSGPGLEQGKTYKEIVNLMDFAPTLANMLNMSPPEHSQGKIIPSLMD